MNDKSQYYGIRNRWIYIVKYLIVKIYNYNDIRKQLT